MSHIYEWIEDKKSDRSFLRDKKSDFRDANGINATGDMDEAKETVDKKSRQSMDDLEI